MIDSKRFTADDNTKYCAEDIRFTTKGRYLYAIVLDWPGERLTIKSIRPAEGKVITTLGYDKKLKWEYTKNSGLALYLPREWQKADKRPGKYAFVFRLDKNAVTYIDQGNRNIH